MLIGGVFVAYTATWVMSLQWSVEAPIPEHRWLAVSEETGGCGFHNQCVNKPSALKTHASGDHPTPVRRQVLGSQAARLIPKTSPETVEPR